MENHVLSELAQRKQHTSQYMYICTQKSYKFNSCNGLESLGKNGLENLGNSHNAQSLAHIHENVETHTHTQLVVSTGECNIIMLSHC